MTGGQNNTASGNRSTVGGGEINVASGNYTIVGGGQNNTASDSYATVGGGYINTASNGSATVAGGYDNSTANDWATVGGGYVNNATGSAATGSGGYGNTASSNYTTVSGGYANDASGYAATVAGGYENTAAGDYSFVIGSFAKNTDPSHDGVFLFADDAGIDFESTASNEFAARANGGVRFVVGSTTCTLNSGDTDWQCGMPSSQTLKSDFQTVDPRTVLDQIVNMPVQTWSYNGTDIRHIGPVAEDFYAVFGLGSSDQKIEFVDANGVNLAAIQGLYEVVQEKDGQIASLESRFNLVLLTLFFTFLTGIGVGFALYFQHRKLRDSQRESAIHEYKVP